MPKCIDCGVEVVWTGLFGPPDQPRCADCREKHRLRRGPRRGGPIWRGRRPPLPPPVTTSVLALSVAASLFYWSPNALGQMLDANSSAVWEGELWRLLTSALVHADVIHLAFNLYWLWRFGRAVELWLGPVRFAGLLVLLAVGSSAAQFLTTGPGVGLSGVVYGLFGLLFALRKSHRFAAAQLAGPVVPLFAGWFLLCVVLTYTGAWRVGNVAHGVGCALGWLGGEALFYRRRAWLLAGLAAVSAALALLTLYMPWDGGYALHRATECKERGDVEGNLSWLERAQHAVTHRLGEPTAAPSGDEEFD